MQSLQEKLGSQCSSWNLIHLISTEIVCGSLPSFAHLLIRANITHVHEKSLHFYKSQVPHLFTTLVKAESCRSPWSRGERDRVNLTLIHESEFSAASEDVRLNLRHLNSLQSFAKAQNLPGLPTELFCTCLKLCFTLLSHDSMFSNLLDFFLLFLFVGLQQLLFSCFKLLGIAKMTDVINYCKSNNSSQSLQENVM